MLVVVLFTLLLLAGILAATMRLSLGSRQNTADQAATLRAQYAAESGLALARSKLSNIETLLSQAEGSSTIGLKLAKTTRLAAVRGWVESLCGSGTWDAMTQGKNNGPGFYDKAPDKNYPAAVQCVPTNLNSDDNFILFAKIVQTDSYSVLPQSERPALTEAAIKSFWRTLLTSPYDLANTSAGSRATTRLLLTRIVKLQGNHYRVFLRVPSVAVTASGNAGASRVLAAQSEQSGEWWFDIAQPSLLDAVVQDDYHTSVAGAAINFTTTTRFQGPIKTNDIFTFTTSAGNNSPSFSGVISSAGCTDRIVTASEATCTRSPGVRIGTTVKRDFTGNDATRSTSIRNYIRNQGINVNYNGTIPNYASEYQPFPEAATIQENAANGKDENGVAFADGSRGLVLGTNEVGIKMFVGDRDMKVPTTYDSSNRTWAEPSPSYQYFMPMTDPKCTEDFNGTCAPVYSNTIYRVDQNMNMQSKTGTGDWTAMSGKFNGVIFKSGTATGAGLSLMGPGRTADDKALPAVASFMGITVATPRQLDIRSDLALSQSPCRFDEYESTVVTPPCKDRKNVLGLFSSESKILIKKQVPNNAVLQAAVMSSQKEVAVEGHDDGDHRGNLSFTGSMVEKYYGANGTFGGTKCIRWDRWGRCIETAEKRTGYDRDYSHDKRFLEGLTPPFYPVSPKWDMTDASRDGNSLDNLIFKQGS